MSSWLRRLLARKHGWILGLALAGLSFLLYLTLVYPGLGWIFPGPPLGPVLGFAFFGASLAASFLGIFFLVFLIAGKKVNLRTAWAMTAASYLTVGLILHFIAGGESLWRDLATWPLAVFARLVCGEWFNCKD